MLYAVICVCMCMCKRMPACVLHREGSLLVFNRMLSCVLLAEELNCTACLHYEITRAWPVLGTSKLMTCRSSLFHNCFAVTISQLPISAPCLSSAGLWPKSLCCYGTGHEQAVVFSRLLPTKQWHIWKAGETHSWHCLAVTMKCVLQETAFSMDELSPRAVLRGHFQQGRAVA